MSKSSYIIWHQKRKKEIQSKIRATAIYSLMFLIGIIGFMHGAETAIGSDKNPSDMMDGEFYEVECTAYYNPSGNLTASGHRTIEGVTIAGAKEWLGCTCIMYDEDMNFIGFYVFEDTGYGKDGDIPRGETVDLFFESRKDALEWGKRNVFIQIIPSVG